MLLYLADLIIEYGLEHLDRMSIEEEVIPTKAMANELMENLIRLHIVWRILKIGSRN